MVDRRAPWANRRGRRRVRVHVHSRVFTFLSEDSNCIVDTGFVESCSVWASAGQKKPLSSRLQTHRTGRQYHSDRQNRLRRTRPRPRSAAPQGSPNSHRKRQYPQEVRLWQVLMKPDLEKSSHYSTQRILSRCFCTYFYPVGTAV